MRCGYSYLLVAPVVFALSAANIQALWEIRGREERFRMGLIAIPQGGD
jgi:hypothetical protein